MRIGCPKPYMRMSPLYVNAKMNNCNGKIPVRLIKTYNIQLLDENTLVIETGVSAKDILLIEEYKKEIMDALKARQKAEQASASEFQCYSRLERGRISARRCGYMVVYKEGQNTS